MTSSSSSSVKKLDRIGCYMSSKSRCNSAVGEMRVRMKKPHVLGCHRTSFQQNLIMFKVECFLMRREGEISTYGPSIGFLLGIIHSSSCVPYELRIRRRERKRDRETEGRCPAFELKFLKSWELNPL